MIARRMPGLLLLGLHRGLVLIEQVRELLDGISAWQASSADNGLQVYRLGDGA